MERKQRSGELITWYLARLRNNARQNSLERKLTPLTLVETDKTLIQEIVMQSHAGYDQKAAVALKDLQRKNNSIRTSQYVLMSIATATMIYFLYLCLW